MKSFFSALSFLTVFPVPQKWIGNEIHLKRSVYYYPLVGCLLGGTLGGLMILLQHLSAPLLSSTIVVAAMVFVSRGLHMDGLADSADGMMSSKPRGKMLEIMRDSRIGPMGTLAVVLVLLVKVAGLASLNPNLAFRAAVLMPIVGRCSLLLTLGMLPYARTEGGLAGFTRSRNNYTLLLIGVLSAWILGKLAADCAGVLAALATMLVVTLFALHTKQKLGGYTGDTLGAGCEIAEAVLPFCMLFFTSSDIFHWLPCP